MKTPAFVAAVVLAVALFAHEAKPIQPASAFPLHGANVVSPNESGWHIVKSDRSEVVFEKHGDDGNSVASAKTFKAAGSGEKLLADLEKSKDVELNALPGRKRDSLHFYRVKFKGLICLQYDGISPASEAAKPAFQYFNFRGYQCALPGAGDLVLELQLSDESNVRGMSEHFSNLADEFFEESVKATKPK